MSVGRHNYQFWLSRSDLSLATCQLNGRRLIEVGLSGRTLTFSTTNKAQVEVLRRFHVELGKILATCPRPPHEVSDPAHCGDCGYLEAECVCV